MLCRVKTGFQQVLSMAPTCLIWNINILSLFYFYLLNCPIHQVSVHTHTISQIHTAHTKFDLVSFTIHVLYVYIQSVFIQLNQLGYIQYILSLYQSVVKSVRDQKLLEFIVWIAIEHQITTRLNNRLMWHDN